MNHGYAITSGLFAEGSGNASFNKQPCIWTSVLLRRSQGLPDYLKAHVAGERWHKEATEDKARAGTFRRRICMTEACPICLRPSVDPSVQRTRSTASSYRTKSRELRPGWS